ncbi:hypothetical protein IFM89_034930 [Coptis chinensis]|uniref:Uncharacterized protein n=1 Tax=Coptis chinensis TaxID=261450 RepID=A0A835I7U2_9MAGN|nr:hypothetical protein IFM89_034930 [Coptis chinensis]
MFLPGRMAFIFNVEDGFSHDIPTTVHRSKADCPVPEEMVTVSVDGSVLDRITKIMSYLRLGSSGKVLKKKKKDNKDMKGKLSAVANGDNEDEKPALAQGRMLKHQTERERLPSPPPLKSYLDSTEKQSPPIVRVEEDDIFVGEGIDYTVPNKDVSQSPASEDMQESPRNRETQNYFTGPAYGPVPPSDPAQNWQQADVYGAMQAQVGPSGYQEVWQEYPNAEQFAYPEQYLQQNLQAYDVQTGTNFPQDPRLMTQEEKDRGFGSVFKRDDERLQQLREKDAREKDPGFISESYSECYPGYQEYNREVVDSDDEDDLSKMDMGGRAKGRLHRWDFETEEEWATYNEQKEAMPKAAFQFGVKMQDGRKARKQNKDQKLTNELHKINKILARKKGESHDDDGEYDDEMQPGKKIRV